MTRSIIIEQPCTILVRSTHYRGSEPTIWRATIWRKGKPDLDDFGATPFAALWNAVASDEDLKKGNWNQ